MQLAEWFDLHFAPLEKHRTYARPSPAVRLLERSKDFPKNGPVLIITDGQIESSLCVKHEHAYLLPCGNRLPFAARGPVFFLKKADLKKRHIGKRFLVLFRRTLSAASYGTYCSLIS